MATSVPTPASTGYSAANNMASLFISDLHPEVTESVLLNKFGSVGPVLSIRVLRDAHTRCSLGYAYVYFHKPADAERALDTMNLDPLNGKPMRIMWSSDPVTRRSGNGNICIKNLDKSIDNATFYKVFSLYGTILSCKVAIDDKGNSKGYGFVHYETEDSANRAIIKLNGAILAGNKVFVGKFEPRNTRELGETAKRYTTVFIKNLEEDVDTEKLEKMFSQFGKVTDCSIMHDSDGKAKGFGFVAFENHEQAAKAVAEMHDKQVDGSEKKLFVCFAQKKSERQAELKKKYEQEKAERMKRFQNNNIYVKNLDDNVDEPKLRELFEKFGMITLCKVMRDENGRSKGFGFVCFEKSEEAAKAITEMNGNLTFTRPLYVALAQRKEDRRSHLATLYMSRLANMRMNNTIPATMYTPGTGGYFVNSALAQMSGRPAVVGAPVRGTTPTGPMQRPVMYNRYAAAASVPTGAPGRTRSGMLFGGQDTLPSRMLSRIAPQEQKQVLGELIYSQIGTIYGDRSYVGRITEMMLEMDNSKLLMLLEDAVLFRSKVDEIAQVLGSRK